MSTARGPVPRHDFYPTGAGVPWGVLTEAGHAVVFATLLAWRLTRHRLGDDDRRHPQTVRDEVSTALRSPLDFRTGTPALLRDSHGMRRVGFTVRDGRCLSARWPGDAHRVAHELAGMLAQTASRA